MWKRRRKRKPSSCTVRISTSTSSSYRRVPAIAGGSLTTDAISNEDGNDNQNVQQEAQSQPNSNEQGVDITCHRSLIATNNQGQQPHHQGSLYYKVCTKLCSDRAVQYQCQQLNFHAGAVIPAPSHVASVSNVEQGVIVGSNKKFNGEMSLFTDKLILTITIPSIGVKYPMLCYVANLLYQ